jgi:hypothetical protein
MNDSDNNKITFNRLQKEVRSVLKNLDQVEIEAYAAHFYKYQKLHKKYFKDGTYNKFWDIFRALKEGKIQNNQSHRDLGDYGLYLITKLNPPIWGELDELDLIDTVICFRNLTIYLEEEVLGKNR